MSSKMLIDASHPEETRVVVLKGNRIEEFDFEAADKKQLRGNIYLAKVTRVEPSLQAAFVDYGGNRHGFLAFSEIHPDYYQIPHADRQALLDEEARAHRDEEDESRNSASRRSRRNRREVAERPHERRGPAEETISEPEDRQTETLAAVDGPLAFDGMTDEATETALTVAGEDHIAGEEEGTTPLSEASSAGDMPPVTDAAPAVDVAPIGSDEVEENHEEEPSNGDDHEAAPSSLDLSEENAVALMEGGGDSLIDASPDDGLGHDDPVSEVGGGHAARSDDNGHGDGNGHDEGEEEFVEQIGGDAFEETAQRAPRPRRHHYKIQEVIKRRQILLVQVVKEERGNKGAALTTYLSLAGRYSVLMPNTARGGGISRKITDAEDRKRLKSIAQDLEVPEGMGIILRTAGASRGPVEVNRDFEYLLRMWESVRELTLKSTAPTLVYEEGSLIKRSIRDLYTREVEDILVSGEEGYREAKEFMRMLMPGAAKSVQLYRDPQPIFVRAGAESQLDAMFSNHVTLKSGGYLVINPTEALVAIDVNSGRSTREHNIEDTALRTNLEAADEVARQLRLRDLAGLIVVDFIDMEEGRNNRAVERRIKEALKNDRARIQIGRISHFGLLEMSRQRIRTGVLEGSTVICPHCAGAGTIRSTASIALHVLRLLEDALIRDASHNLIVRTRTEVALYLLNHKRAKLTDLETRFGVSVTIAVDASLTGMIYHAIERGEVATPLVAPPPRADLVRVDSVAPLYEDDDEEAEDEAGEDVGVDTDAASTDRSSSRDAEAGAEGGRRRKRRRRRRGRDRDAFGEVSPDAPQPSDDGLATMAHIEGDFPAPGEMEDRAPDLASDDAEPDLETTSERQSPLPGTDAADEADVVAASDVEAEMVPEEAEAPEQPRRRRSRRSAKAEDEAAKRLAAEGSPVTGEEGPNVEAASPPPRRRRSRSKAVAPVAEAVPTPTPAVIDEPIGELPLQAPPDEAETKAEPTLAAGEGETPTQDPDVEKAPQSAAPVPEDNAETAAEPESSPNDPALPKRSGWWQRAKATFGS